MLLNLSKRSFHLMVFSSLDFRRLGRSYDVVGVGGTVLISVNKKPFKTETLLEKKKTYTLGGT
jgi:hypothetical protein